MAVVNSGDAYVDMAGNKSSSMKNLVYRGMDIGAWIDFKAVHKLVKTALAKIPKGQCPEGCEAWTVTLVLHPTEEEGAAWVQEHNPYKTWGW